MKKDRKRNNFYVVFGITFAAIVLAMAVSLFVLPEKAYSDREDRALAHFPVLTSESLKTGLFRSEIEEFARDQFVFRDLASNIRGGTGQILGNRESNGIFLLESGRMAESFTAPDEGRTIAFRNALTRFAASRQDVNLYFLLAPTAIGFYVDELPKYASTGDQNAYIDEILGTLPENVEAIDVRAAFREELNRTELYYRTDPHWTMGGARIAAAALLLKTGCSVRLSGVFGKVTDSFVGALAQKSGFTPELADGITVYQIGQDPERDFYFTVRYADEQTESASVYYTPALSGRDPYQVFLGKPTSRITIRTSIETEKRLLLVKDSFANEIVPLLLDSYAIIEIVDPELYQRDLNALIEEQEITDVVFLYNANTLSQDRALTELLRKSYQKGHK